MSTAGRDTSGRFKEHTVFITEIAQKPSIVSIHFASRGLSSVASCRRVSVNMSAGEVKKEVPTLTVHTYPLCKLTDMPEDMKQEALELCVTAAEKYSDNYEHAARMIKDSMDKKFGSPFQVVVGEACGFSVTHQSKTLIYMYTGGNIAILIWRTVSAFL